MPTGRRLTLGGLLALVVLASGACTKTEGAARPAAMSPAELRRVDLACDRLLEGMVVAGDPRTSRLRSLRHIHARMREQVDRQRQWNRSAQSIANVEKIARTAQANVDAATTTLLNDLLQRAGAGSEDRRLIDYLRIRDRCAPLEEKLARLTKRDDKLRANRERSARALDRATWALHLSAQELEEAHTRNIITLRRTHDRAFASATAALLRARSRWKRTKPAQAERYAKYEAEAQRIQDEVYLPAREAFRNSEPEQWVLLQAEQADEPLPVLSDFKRKRVERSKDERARATTDLKRHAAWRKDFDREHAAWAGALAPLAAVRAKLLPAAKQALLEHPPAR